jgi:exocyst complex component 6
MRQWLLEMREISGAVGAAALDAQQSRAKKWRARIDRDTLLKPSRVGSSVELAFWEKSEGTTSFARSTYGF